MSASVRRILVVQLRQVGDVLLAAPVVSALRRRYQEAHIDYMVETYSAAAARGIPGVDGLVEVERKLSPGQLLALRRRLRDADYDLAVDVQGNQKTAMYTWMTGAPRRVGFAPPWKKAHLRLAYTDMVERNYAPRYTCLYRLDLLRALGIETDDVRLGYRPPQAASETATAWFAAQEAPATSWVALSPGGRVPLKSWPLERYTELGKRLVGRGYRVLALHGPGEREVAEELVAGIGEGAALEEAGSYEEHAAMLAGCVGAVMNDGGNLHLAVALDVPSVCLFGPTDPRIWASPDTTRHRALRGECPCTPEEVHSCSPKRCLTDTTAEAVETALLEVMGGVAV
jgi:ADP-heptose:LPS heptosyltransferase